MTLSKLIEILDGCTYQGKIVNGFTEAHSYCGDYESIAFKPNYKTTIGAMLAECTGALNKTFKNRGETFVMTGDTEVYIAYPGFGGIELNNTGLANILWA